MKESSRFFSVEALALPNLRQTLRGRERSELRGYALYLLFTYLKREGKQHEHLSTVTISGHFSLANVVPVAFD